MNFIMNFFKRIKGFFIEELDELEVPKPKEYEYWWIR
jgi:hypothetical protein